MPGSPEATQQAVGLIKQARQAVSAGDLAKAKKLNDQARALKPNLHWWDDNPEKVQGENARAERFGGRFCESFSSHGRRRIRVRWKGCQ